MIIKNAQWASQPYYLSDYL